MKDEIKKYCEGLDCAICDEKEPCIYKIANELQEQLKAKEQECEELKKEIAFGNNGTLSDKIRAEVFKELNNENNQLKQTLTEIRELLLKTPTDSPMHCVNAKSVILQKISEVEDGI